MEKTTTLELQKNKESMRRIFEEAWSKGKVEVLDELVAPTFKQHQYDRPSTREDFKAVIKEVRTAFPDLKVTAEDSVAGDDKVWMRVTFRGTHLGQFKGISSSFPNMGFFVQSSGAETDCNTVLQRYQRP